MPCTAEAQSGPLFVIVAEKLCWKQSTLVLLQANVIAPEANTFATGPGAVCMFVDGAVGEPPHAAATNAKTINIRS